MELPRQSPAPQHIRIVYVELRESIEASILSRVALAGDPNLSCRPENISGSPLLCTAFQYFSILFGPVLTLG